ncbi:MAG: hypothetical protein KatS3mg110_4198 [Pirellulaceae bacterium]|nr:MAG: hypothetical protein KatS3mg110_4198 [Pirellulaceae bacterium]
MFDVLGVVLFIALGVALVGIIAYWNWQREKRRTEELSLVAETLSMQFDGTDAAEVQRFNQFQLLQTAKRTSHKIYNVMWSDADNERLIVFDLDYVVGSGKERHTVKQTVVGFDSPQLAVPVLFLARQRWYHSLGKVLGMQDVELPDYPEFSKSFLVRGDEQGIPRWITREFVEVMMDDPSVTCEARAGKMLIYRLGRRVNPSQMREFLRHAFRIVSAAKRASSQNVPNPR